MAKMNIAPSDRPRVKAQCLRLLVTLKLDPARMQLISGFVDTYLKLTPEEETTFNLEVGNLIPQAQEGVMEIVTSWMERGIEQGRQEGLEQTCQEAVVRETAIFVRLLNQRFNQPIPAFITTELQQLTLEQIERFGLNLLGYEAIADVLAWLYGIGDSDAQQQRCLRLLAQQLGVLPGELLDELQEEVAIALQSFTTDQLKQLSAVQLKFETVADLQEWVHEQANTHGKYRNI